MGAREIKEQECLWIFNSSLARQVFLASIGYLSFFASLNAYKNGQKNHPYNSIKRYNWVIEKWMQKNLECGRNCVTLPFMVGVFNTRCANPTMDTLEVADYFLAEDFLGYSSRSTVPRLLTSEY